MANYETLKSAIQNVVKTNGNNEITGALLQQTLLAMINSLGAGYQFMGVAIPSTNPGTSDQRVFYIANGKGTYTNFDGISIAEDEVIILYYDTAWHKLLTGIASQEKLTELAGKVDEKQDALTLTVKDNGNIVLANIQGQSKEFMPATPSGDPMHYAYVTAGAEYNDTGADIVKTAPWEDMIDDDYTGEYGKTVVHKAGCWYLNGLGDITNDEIREIYQVSSNIVVSDLQILSYFSPYIPLKTMFPINATSVGWTGSIRILTNQAFFNMKKGVVFRIAPTSRVLKLRGFEMAHIGIFNYSSILHCLDIIEFEGTIENEFGLSRCTTIITIKITSLKYDLNISKTNALSVKSVLYMINKEAATSPITITLHKTVYDRCMANADILAALEAHKNISLASPES